MSHRVTVSYCRVVDGYEQNPGPPVGLVDAAPSLPDALGELCRLLAQHPAPDADTLVVGHVWDAEGRRWLLSIKGWRGEWRVSA